MSRSVETGIKITTVTSDHATTSGVATSRAAPRATLDHAITLDIGSDVASVRTELSSHVTASGVGRPSPMGRATLDHDIISTTCGALVDILGCTDDHASPLGCAADDADALIDVDENSVVSGIAFMMPDVGTETQMITDGESEKTDFSAVDIDNHARTSDVVDFASVATDDVTEDQTITDGASENLPADVEATVTHATASGGAAFVNVAYVDATVTHETTDGVGAGAPNGRVAGSTSVNTDGASAYDVDITTVGVDHTIASGVALNTELESGIVGSYNLTSFGSGSNARRNTSVIRT